MARIPKATSATQDDGNLHLYEAELAKATERWRIAKLAAREAKANAKIAKKQMKQARKAMIAAQEEQELKAAAASSKKAKAASAKRPRTKPEAPPKSKRRIAGTPEVARRPRAKRARAGNGPVAPSAASGVPQETESTSNTTADQSPDQVMAGTPSNEV